MTTNGPLSVLVVDDDPNIRLILRIILEGDDFDLVGEAAGGEDGVRCFMELDLQPSVVLVDERMPDLSGVHTAERILAHRPNQIVILMSADLDEELVARALGAGILQCIDKAELIRLPTVLRVLLTA
jgi:DNA-binding NarL/FixJ family response regulator